MNTNQQKSVKRKICLFLTSGQFLLSCAKKKKHQNMLIPLPPSVLTYKLRMLD